MVFALGLIAGAPFGRTPVKTAALIGIVAGIPVTVFAFLVDFLAVVLGQGVTSYRSFRLSESW